MMGMEFIPYNAAKVAAWNEKVNGAPAEKGKKGKGKNEKSAAVNQSTNKAKAPKANNK